ncbi:P-loop containing nucleoside triphosphate hydrolase protein [Hypomontagnella submonticulosa]|nr:P-loop containing nucleoside triphosphate hydrolase protein [Hypomontagnella submonticulosa]
MPQSPLLGERRKKTRKNTPDTMADESSDGQDASDTRAENSIEQGIMPESSSSQSTAGNDSLAEAIAAIFYESGSLYLPSWFVNNCIKTFEELTTCEIPLIIDDSPLDQPSGGTPDGKELTHYMVPAGAYNGLFDIVSPLKETEAQCLSDQKQPRKFSHDAMALRMPLRRSGQRFLEVVTQYFARDIGADLLTLCLDDIQNVAMYFGYLAGQASVEAPGDAKDLKSRRPENTSEKPSKNEDPGSLLKLRSAMTFVFKIFLEAIQEKRDLLYETSKDTRPLIVLLPEVTDNFYGPSHKILTDIREAVKNLRDEGEDIAVIALDIQSDIIFGAPNKWPSNDNEFLNNLGFNPLRPVQIVTPSRNEAQRRLLAADFARKLIRSNIRKLQSKTRTIPGVLIFDGLLEPYVDWKLRNGSFAYSRLRNVGFNERELDMLSSALSKTDLDVSNVEKAFERIHAIYNWLYVDKSVEAGKWTSFPRETRQILEKIEESEDHERDLLRCIVSPEDVKQSWADIEIDDDIKESIKQLVYLASSDPKSHYGILSKSRIRGALLYGPPGTGKTQLARVLAHEFKAAMIHVSFADIESQWTGEAEKIIQAVYTLASVIAPCIIFIDEADSLLTKRGRGGHRGSRDCVNQFLSQQDGLTRSEDAPFLLLATNHPDDIDEAVLRRVPARMYLGLPSIVARENMFRMFLREEKLSPDLKLQRLAEQTAGFSGSDINTLCIQAALICQEQLTKADKSSQTREIAQEHFDAAYKKVSSTVSSNGMDRVRRFAEKFDPTAVAKIDKSDANRETDYFNIYL